MRVKPAIRSFSEPEAWTIKYFPAASVSWYDFVPIIAGIKENKFISNPIHITSQSCLESLINVPVIAARIKFIVGGRRVSIKLR